MTRIYHERAGGVPFRGPTVQRNQSQPRATTAKSRNRYPLEVVDLTDGGEWTRTTDLRIMSATQTPSPLYFLQLN